MIGVGVATALTLVGQLRLPSTASVDSYRIGTTRSEADRYWRVQLLTASSLESVSDPRRDSRC